MIFKISISLYYQYQYLFCCLHWLLPGQANHIVTYQQLSRCQGIYSHGVEQLQLFRGWIYPGTQNIAPRYPEPVHASGQGGLDATSICAEKLERSITRHYALAAWKEKREYEMENEDLRDRAVDSHIISVYLMIKACDRSTPADGSDERNGIQARVDTSQSCVHKM